MLNDLQSPTPTISDLSVTVISKSDLPPMVSSIYISLTDYYSQGTRSKNKRNRKPSPVKPGSVDNVATKRQKKVHDTQFAIKMLTNKV